MASFLLWNLQCCTALISFIHNLFFSPHLLYRCVNCWLESCWLYFFDFVGLTTSFFSLFDRGLSYQWGAVSPSEFGERPSSELIGSSPSKSWHFVHMGAGSIPGVLFLFFGYRFWAQNELLLLMWGLLIFGQQVSHWSQYLLFLVWKYLLTFGRRPFGVRLAVCFYFSISELFVSSWMTGAWICPWVSLLASFSE